MNTKRLVSLLLVLVTVITFVTPLASATEVNPTLSVQSVSGVSGGTVDVDVIIKNNPGILGATLTFTYDEGLTLSGVKNGDAFSALSLSKPGNFSSPCNFLWDGEELLEEDITDGTVITLTFEIDEDAPADANYSVAVSYVSGDIYDLNLNPVKLNIENGIVHVIDYIPGDVDGDDEVLTSDIIFLRRHITGGWDVTINEAAGDVNDDGRLNSGDVIYIRRFIAGGWDVELLPSTPRCSHEMTSHPYKAPTYTEAGNIAYWTCSKCEKLFSDEEGLTEISETDTVIAPKDGYSITYYVDLNDTYLQSIDIENQNPAYYSSDESVVLNDLLVNGYDFLGWYTAQTGGERVTEIKVGETGNKVLYAHWAKKEYTVSFVSTMLPQAPMKYAVGEEQPLPVPGQDLDKVLDKYTWIGWTDKDGNLWESIPAGTAMNFTLYENWASTRNKAVPVKKLSDPFIFEDTENGVILFTYEIGELQNVPLFTTLNLNCANGIITTHSKTETSEISSTQASTVAKVVSNATTNTSAWTLSSDWNQSTQISESYLEETGQTREEAETISKSENNSYFLNTSSGGSNSLVSVNGETYKTSVGNSGSNSSYDTSQYNTEWGVGVEGSIGGGSKLDEIIDIGVGLNAHTGEKLARNSGASSYAEWHDNADTEKYHSTTATSTNTWNSSSGYNNSRSVSQSNTISNVMSKVISEQKGYGESYSSGGSNSESQALASTDTKSDEYSSALTYYTSQITSSTTTFSSSGHTVGDYRMVMAGTVHVFAVVGYDIASKSYYVYTYNVLDDKTEEYLDYSYDGTFEDHETGVLPFEIPYYVEQYVNSKTLKTDGLVFNPDTGMIVDYIPTNETPDDIIFIPSYIPVNNNDETISSVKVTGIKPGLFKNNTDIKAVKISDFVTEIPESTFEGCSNLEYVFCPGVTSFNDNAFNGCTSLNTFSVPVEIKHVGDNAFTGLPKVKATASSAAVAQAIATCGAKNIVLDISEIPNDEAVGMVFEIGSAETFELQGKDKEYKGLSVKSDAEKTIINGITFTENSKIPMDFDSDNVTLDRVKAEVAGYALVLKADTTNLSLNRTINLRSTSENAILCKNLNLAPLTSDVTGLLNVNGNILVCGEISGEKYLTVSNGEIIHITEEEFNNYLSSHQITFNATGGTVAIESKMASLNMPIGELPTPSRDYYTFDGWYTEVDGGDVVTAETLMTSLTDITLYAHWVHNDAVWAPAEDVPTDAEIVDRKWSYTQTLYNTSYSPTLSGWTQYDSERTAWGSTVGPVYNNPANGTRNVWSESYVKSTTTYYKYYHRWNGVDKTAAGGGRWGDYRYTSWIEHAIELTYQLSKSGTYETDIQFYGSSACPKCSAQRMWVPNGTRTAKNYGTRWYYQEPVYTYYFSKTEDVESREDPSTLENVSNIVEWVQYRTK